MNLLTLSRVPQKSVGTQLYSTMKNSLCYAGLGLGGSRASYVVSVLSHKVVLPALRGK